VDDPAAGHHPVDLARDDGDGRAEAVAMHDLAGVEVGQRREPDVWVGADVDSLAGREGGRAHAVEEDEGPDITSLVEGQNTADGEAAEVLRARIDDERDEVGVRLETGDVFVGHRGNVMRPDACVTSLPG
jgi:hypothetical protein